MTLSEFIKKNYKRFKPSPREQAVIDYFEQFNTMPTMKLEKCKLVDIIKEYVLEISSE